MNWLMKVCQKKMLKNKSIIGSTFGVFVAKSTYDLDLLLLPNFITKSHIGRGSQNNILSLGSTTIKGIDINSIPSSKC